MAKIFSNKLHGSDNSGIEFGAVVVGAIHHVRQQMAYLERSDKADEYAPGAIHALRKLCDGEGKNLSIITQEVEEWRDIFCAWLDRVGDSFPDEHIEQFRTNASEDFEEILSCSSKLPSIMWKNDVQKRYIKIAFKNEHEMDRAQKAADTKHPVKLGNALHKYIEKCVDDLIAGDTDD